jgi:hypothetical protein
MQMATPCQWATLPGATSSALNPELTFTFRARTSETPAAGHYKHIASLTVSRVMITQDNRFDSSDVAMHALLVEANPHALDT